MSHKLLTDSRLFQFIERIDQDTVARIARRCLHCGGPLDRADYPRKPRGQPAGTPCAYERRPSYCCREDGCRRRLTPPLVGLLGRRVYLSVVVVLVAACRQGASPLRLQALKEAVGVTPRTVRRWLVWWKEVFPQTSAWQLQRAALVPPVADALLPTSLLERLSPLDDLGFGGVGLLLRHLAS
jgi:hypothetical protein